jgi:hypothetical protein
MTVPWTQVLVRTQGQPLAMLHSIRQQIAATDPDQQIISNVRDLQGWIETEPEFQPGRLISILFGAFSALGLTLAAVGLYRVVSYTVVQRTSELGSGAGSAAAGRAAPRRALCRNQRRAGHPRRPRAQLRHEPSDCPLDRERNARSAGHPGRVARAVRGRCSRLPGARGGR